MSQLTDATPAERHRILADRFADIAENVTDWEAPTPVREWRAVDVVEHLGWLPGMLGGMGVTLHVAEEGTPLERFRAQSAAVQAILDGPDAAREVETGSMGVLPLAQVIDSFYTFDLFAHAWDLARASGQQVDLDDDFAARAYAGMSATGPALHASGHFGQPQPVPDDASSADRLIALIGRDPSWQH